ncbi:MAG: hypothetical protein WCX08_03330 [Candidatus Buchananbacteria bacterium]|jgi:hypothetical protein
MKPTGKEFGPEQPIDLRVQTQDFFASQFGINLEEYPGYWEKIYDLFKEAHEKGLNLGDLIKNHLINGDKISDSVTMDLLIRANNVISGLNSRITSPEQAAPGTTLQTMETPVVPSETTNLHEKAIQIFLDEIDYILESGINKITRDELREKLIELFKAVGDKDKFSNLDKRLLETYNRFNSWLTSEKGIDTNQAAKFCMPILRRIIERSLKSEQIRKNPDRDRDNVIQFKREEK